MSISIFLVSENNYTDYFKKSLKSNLRYVFSSLIVSFFTSIILFSKLSSIDYIIYSVAQITVYFFVDISSLEFGKIIRKKSPILNSQESEKLIKNLIKPSIFFFTGLYIFYLLISNYFDIYRLYGEKKIYFFIAIFSYVIIQIVNNFIGEYVGGVQRFDAAENYNLYFSIPSRILFVVLFYLYFTNLIFVLVGNFLIRLVNLIIVLKVSRFHIFFMFKNSKSDKLEKFNFKTNLKFSINNFIFFNYPSFYFSYVPVFLEKFHSPKDIAVISLSISLFNSIRPVLNGVLMIINPAIQKLNHDNKKPQLYRLINFIYEIISISTIYLISIIFFTLNFEPFTETILKRFSYNLFADLSMSAVYLSLLYLLNLIYHSYFLAINLEKLIFKSSIYSIFLSASIWLSYEVLNQKINLVFLIILSFYLLNLVFFIRSKVLVITSSYNLLYVTTLIFLISLKTNFYDFFPVFIFAITVISVLYFKKIRDCFKKYGVNIKFLNVN